MRCVLANFEQVVASDDFLQISGDTLTDVLQRDELRVVSEENVLAAVLR